MQWVVNIALLCFEEHFDKKVDPRLREDDDLIRADSLAEDNFLNLYYSPSLRGLGGVVLHQNMSFPTWSGIYFFLVFLNVNFKSEKMVDPESSSGWQKMYRHSEVLRNSLYCHFRENLFYKRSLLESRWLNEGKSWIKFRMTDSLMRSPLTNNEGSLDE